MRGRERGSLTLIGVSPVARPPPGRRDSRPGSLPRPHLAPASFAFTVLAAKQLFILYLDSSFLPDSEGGAVGGGRACFKPA